MKTTNTRVPFRTLTEKFQFVAREDSTITSDMEELDQCSIPLIENQIEKLWELNPTLAQWISDCEAEHSSFHKSLAGIRKLFRGEESPPAPRLAIFLYVVFGMRILICGPQGMKFQRNLFLRFLNQLYRDRALLAGLVGSCVISQSARFSSEVDGKSIHFSLRDLKEGGNFITIDMTMPPLCSVMFPPLKSWEQCGLGWLSRNNLCCYFHYRSRTPWKKKQCR